MLNSLFYFKLCLLLIASFPFLTIEAKSISQYGKYVEYCLLASQEEEEFQHFKRHPIYRCILEHATRQQGQQYLDYIYWQNPQFLMGMEKFRKNDGIGDPITYYYPLIGRFSPTTLQYVKVASDLMHYFGKLDQWHIVEIGGGYGGQCLILSEATGFQHYTLIDLPESLLLAEKYLKVQDINRLSFVPPAEINHIPQADLLISNYAFSEIDYEEQLNYLSQLIKRIPHGYMIINFISKLFGINTLSLEELVQFLENQGARVITLPEVPPTGDHNVIVMWKPSYHVG